MTNVLVIDGQPLYREGLLKHLGKCFSVEETGLGGEACGLIQSFQPNVVVAELVMPDDIAGWQILRTLHDKRDGLGSKYYVSFLSQLTQIPEGGVVQAISLGLSGYLSKDLEGGEIAAAIQQIATGRLVFNQLVQRELFGELQAGRPILSVRERQILEGVANGATAAKIGQVLHLSTSTIKTHISHVYRKLGVQNQGAAVREGMRLKILE